MAYIGNKPVIGSTKKVDSFTALQNNVRVTFPLTITNSLLSYELKPVSPYSILVVKNGNLLEPDRDYSVSGGNITFSLLSKPLSTDTVFITTLSEPITIGVPGDGTVTDQCFLPESVTYDKLTQTAKDTIISNIITFGL